MTEKDNNKWKIFAWISTAIAVSIGIYFTHNPKCLWALFIPMWA